VNQYKYIRESSTEAGKKPSRSHNPEGTINAKAPYPDFLKITSCPASKMHCTHDPIVGVHSFQTETSNNFIAKVYFVRLHLIERTRDKKAWKDSYLTNTDLQIMLIPKQRQIVNIEGRM
jgi:hypothetical protein